MGVGGGGEYGAFSNKMYVYIVHNVNTMLSERRRQSLLSLWLNIFMEYFSLDSFTETTVL